MWPPWRRGSTSPSPCPTSSTPSAPGSADRRPRLACGDPRGAASVPRVRGRAASADAHHRPRRVPTMIKLTCLLRRKEGLTPAEFHAYWREHHGPLIANSSAAKYVLRYEQNPRPLDDYRDDDDRSGYDGVTVQWFDSMEAYYAHMGEDDFPAMMEDIARFLDTDRLEVVLTEEPRIIIDGRVDW